MSKYWGGNDVDGWIAEIESDNEDRVETAIYSLGEMSYQGYFTDDNDFFRAAKAISAATHSNKSVIRQRAYYSVGVMVKILAFDLTRGSDFERQRAQVAIRSIIRSSAKLTSPMVGVLPDLLTALAKSPSFNPGDLDEIEAKLLAQESEGTKDDKRLVVDALKCLRDIRAT